MQEKEIANFVDVKLSPPEDLDLGPAPRSFYPLVLVSTCHQNQDVYQIHVIHIGDSMHFKTHVLAHYLKWPNSKVTHIIPFYEHFLMRDLKISKFTGNMLTLRIF